MADADAKELIRAVEMALDGDWEGAHAIAQSLEGDPHADWLHAIVHKIEGDEDNSRYWYGRTAHAYADFSDPTVELNALRASLSR